MIEAPTYQYARGPHGRSYHCVEVDAGGQVTRSLCGTYQPSELTMVMARRPVPTRICRLCRRAEDDVQ